MIRDDSWDTLRLREIVIGLMIWANRQRTMSEPARPVK